MPVLLPQLHAPPHGPREAHDQAELEQLGAEEDERDPHEAPVQPRHRRRAAEHEERARDRERRRAVHAFEALAERHHRLDAHVAQGHAHEHAEQPAVLAQLKVTSGR